MTLHEGGDYRDMISSGASDAPTEVVTPLKNGWVHTHPFLATSVGVGGLIILGLSLVLGRVDVAPSSQSGAWGGAGGGFFSIVRRPAPVAAPPDTRLQAPEDTYASIPIFTPVQENPAQSPANDDFMAILAGLVQATPVTTDTPTSDSASSGYSFIPQGLVSTELETKKQTPGQRALFAYGNEVGTYLKAYEDTHTNSPQITKDHIEDRTNETKARAVRYIGDDMRQFGASLKELTDIPAAAKGMHLAYAGAYITAGENLMKVADAKTDDEFVSAVTAYNSSVESLSNRFQMLVILFGVNEVTFSASDQGNVFTFSPTLSLPQ